MNTKVQVLDASRGIVGGYAVVFSTADEPLTVAGAIEGPNTAPYHGHYVTPESKLMGYDKPVKVLLHHATQWQVGKLLTAQSDKVGYTVQVQLDPAALSLRMVADGKDSSIGEMLHDGRLYWCWSINYPVIAADGWLAWGVFDELSVTPYPAYEPIYPKQGA